MARVAADGSRWPGTRAHSALAGSPLNLAAAMRLLIAALAVMLATLASIGPIVCFFSFTTTSYPFMVLLNVLVFALAQGLFWAGIVSTFVMGLGTVITVSAIAMLAVGARSLAKRLSVSPTGYGTLVLRGFEVGAACLVILVGVALLSGYMASERMGLF